ncbi:angiotensin-converting enzyme [Cryptotermes secundus]|nr:angiotensin-converting enzyme [Cryptotermes secundus]
MEKQDLQRIMEMLIEVKADRKVDKEEMQRECRKNKQKLKQRKENDFALAMVRNQEPAKKCSKLVLPEPQISDQFFLLLQLLLLPYFLAADLWRLEALTGNLTNITGLNSSWRQHRKNMQLVSIPTGDDNIFDFLSDPYITSNKPYLGKFCRVIWQFQLFQKVLEGTDMDSSEMNITRAFAENEDVRKLLYGGKSKNWADLLKEVMGINDLDSGPLMYFQKLESYLAKLEQLNPVKTSRHVPDLPVHHQQAL